MTDKKRNTASLIIYTLLLAAMLGLIVFLTFQSSEDTMRLSGGVQKLLIAIFGGERAPEWLSDSHLIRSAAHFPLYFLLGTVIWLWVRALFRVAGTAEKKACRRSDRLFAISVVSVFLSACCGLADESVKRLIPPRHFEPRDLALDILAAVLAALICSAAASIFGSRRD